MVVDEVERELGRVEAREDGLHREAALSLVARLVAAAPGIRMKSRSKPSVPAGSWKKASRSVPRSEKSPEPAIAAPRPSAPTVSLSEKNQPTGGVRTRCHVVLVVALDGHLLGQVRGRPQHALGDLDVARRARRSEGRHEIQRVHDLHAEAQEGALAPVEHLVPHAQLHGHAADLEARVEVIVEQLGVLADVVDRRRRRGSYARDRRAPSRSRKTRFRERRRRGSPSERRSRRWSGACWRRFLRRN